MNRIFKNTVRAGVIALITSVSLGSCSDTWDDHYESLSGLTYDGSLLGYLQDNPDLSDFVEVVKASGFDKDLASNQVLTVIAPKNGSFDKQYYLNLIQNGRKKEVIDEFIKNHICRYNISMGAEEQTVTMMNKKNVKLGTISEGTIEEENVDKMNVSCSNGVVHVIDGYLPYQYNIYEFLAKDWRDNYTPAEPLPALDENGEAVEVELPPYETLYGYLSEMYVDSLDEPRSVSRGVDENGDQIWVDSVVISNNKILRRLDAYLYREDSTYITLLPDFDAYNRRFQGIKGLFNFNVSYNSDQAVRDSVQRYWAHYYSLCDLSYNMGQHQNIHTQDSLFSTAFSRWSWPYNVYYNPYEAEGIMSSVYETIDCSNGQVCRVHEYPFDVYTNVFKKITLEGESRFYIYEDGENQFTNKTSTSYNTVANAADTISGSGYLHVVPAQSSRQTELTFQLPNTLSGQYDIYIKFLPYQVYAPEDTEHTNLPIRFRCSLYERNATNGAFPAYNRATVDFYSNPEKKERNFQTDPNCIDSLYIGTYKFNYCYLNTTPGVLFKIQSNVTSGVAKQFTKEMLIDKIVLIPNRERHDDDGLYTPESN
ncbi:MAG: fasciclin domain-containing protein [Bacteroidaceae bacterium]|nr:fasciclin domain-containing protein [Bacteroidaceae bacterium]